MEIGGVRQTLSEVLEDAQLSFVALGAVKTSPWAFLYFFFACKQFAFVAIGFVLMILLSLYESVFNTVLKYLHISYVKYHPWVSPQGRFWGV